jgi:hypothetical protein
MDKRTIAHREHSFQEQQKVIKIISNNGNHKLFTNYHQVCNYINTIEQNKTLESTETWSFKRRRYKTLCLLYYKNQPSKYCLTSKEREAIEKETGLTEIIKGNKKHMIQFLSRNCTDIEPLKRDWCKEYCKTYGLTLLELELVSKN